MKKFLYRLKWRLLRPQAFLQFERLRQSECKDRDELAAEQEQSRQRIVRHALEASPFYRRHYAAAGFSAAEIGTPGWFERLPIVTKADLRNHFESFVDPDARRHLRYMTTGGSTGAPTKTGYDGRIPEETYSWRLQAAYGVNPWDDHAYVWRARHAGFLASFANALMWWPTRHLKLDASFMTDESIAVFLKKYVRLRPKLLQGYVGAIAQVAQYVLDHPQLHSAVRSLPTKVVWTTSAPLSSVQRALIEKAFGAPVCNEYGSCECRWLAREVPGHKGLKMNTEHAYIEYVDEAGAPVAAGTYGRALITNLEDTVFPLIRYENGDRGRLLEYPYIDEVKGREVESFVLPSGKTINGEYLTTIFDAAPDVATNFQVVQHKDLSITVNYVPGTASLPDSIVDNFRKSVGNEVRVEFTAVEAIRHDRGKLRFVVRENE